MEVGVWVLAASMIVILFLYMRVIRKKQDIAIKLALIIFIFLILTIPYVIQKTDFSIKNVKDGVSFGKVYASWLVNVFVNVKTTTAKVIGFDWVGNKTVDDIEREDSSGWLPPKQNS